MEDIRNISLDAESENDINCFCDMYEFLNRDANAYNSIRSDSFEKYSPVTITKTYIPNPNNLRFDYSIFCNGKETIITGKELRDLYEKCCIAISRTPYKDDEEKQIRRLSTCQG